MKQTLFFPILLFLALLNVLSHKSFESITIQPGATPPNVEALVKSAAKSKDVIDHDSITQKVKAAGTTEWVHQAYNQFKGKTKAELVKKYLGFVHPGAAAIDKIKLTDDNKAKLTSAEVKAGVSQTVSAGVSAPYSFHSYYDKWNFCPSILNVRNQGGCGSCWAFASAEVMSDRSCIYKWRQDYISSFNIASCSQANGCGGGWMGNAFNYWKYGTVLEQCQPYRLPLSCNRYSCFGYPLLGYTASLRYGDPTWGSYSIAGNQYAIMDEIYLRGPVTAAFVVYDDFYGYRSGVYYHRVSTVAGGHAIKIIGWGVENGLPYWLCVNSWGTGWGIGGLFKILRGYNEGSIETWGIITGIPKLA